MADLESLLDEIRAGAYDGHETDIVQAVQFRVNAGQIEVGWQINYEDLHITEENLTVGEAKLVQQLLRETDRLASPWPVPTRSPEAVSAYVVAALIHRRGLPRDQAETHVHECSMRDLLGMVSTYTITSPPKDDGEPTTP